MNTRMVTLVVTIAAIALVAVGIGYAYTATTSNSNNSVSTVYLNMSLEAGSHDYSEAFSKNIPYNTDNNAGHVTYTPTTLDAKINTGDTSNNLAVIGYVDITVDTSKMGADDHFNVTMSKGVGTMTGKYYFKVGNTPDTVNATLFDTSNPNTIASNVDKVTESPYTVTYKVTLYAAAADADVVPNMSGVVFSFAATTV